MSNSPAISSSGRPYPALASHRRAPSRWAAAPRSRAQATCSTQLVPGGLLSAEVALRQLPEHRGDRLGDRVQIVPGQQPVALPDRPAASAWTREYASPSWVARWHIGCHSTVRRPRSVGVDPQGGGLRHRPARQEHRSGEAEQIRPPWTRGRQPRPRRRRRRAPPRRRSRRASPRERPCRRPAGRCGSARAGRGSPRPSDPLCQRSGAGTGVALAALSIAQCRVMTLSRGRAFRTTRPNSG